MKDSNNIEFVLWEKLKAGEIEALGKLYDLFIDSLFSYGVQFSSDKPYVMDCIHDLFLDLYKYRKNLSATNNVKYYLLRSLKNKILKKSRGRFVHISDEVYERKAGANYSESVEDTIIQEEFLNDRLLKLSDALNFLSKKQRHALYLKFTAEKDYQDIAKIMNVSVQTSRTIIYRAIKSLRKHLTALITAALPNIFY